MKTGTRRIGDHEPPPSTTENTSIKYHFFFTFTHKYTVIKKKQQLGIHFMPLEAIQEVK